MFSFFHPTFNTLNNPSPMTLLSLVVLKPLPRSHLISVDPFDDGDVHLVTINHHRKKPHADNKVGNNRSSRSLNPQPFGGNDIVCISCPVLLRKFPWSSRYDRYHLHSPFLSHLAGVL